MGRGTQYPSQSTWIIHQGPRCMMYLERFNVKRWSRVTLDRNTTISRKLPDPDLDTESVVHFQWSNVVLLRFRLAYYGNIKRGCRVSTKNLGKEHSWSDQVSHRQSCLSQFIKEWALIWTPLTGNSMFASCKWLSVSLNNSHTGSSKSIIAANRKPKHRQDHLPQVKFNPLDVTEWQYGRRKSATLLFYPRWHE